MQPHTHSATPEIPPPLGWRLVQCSKPDGTTQTVEVPLTLEDVCHPMEGDIIPETPQHASDRTYATIVCDSRIDRLPRIAVVNSDLLTDFDLPDTRAVSPDLGVFFGLQRSRSKRAGVFYPGRVGAQCLFLMEVVSPSTRSNDWVTKVELYHRAKVPLYVIIDQEREDAPRSLVALQWEPGGYVPATLDGEGRLPLPLLGMRLGVSDDRVVFFDLSSNMEIGNYTQINEQLKVVLDREDIRQEEITQAIEEMRQAERRADDEKALRSRADRLASDAQLRARTAEQKARAEAAARVNAELKAKDAEKKAKDAELKAKNAELKAKNEADARAVAEQELARLRQQLAALQSGKPPV